MDRHYSMLRVLLSSPAKILSIPKKATHKKEERGLLSIWNSNNKEKINMQKTLNTNCVQGFLLACLEGLEPPTYWFVASHSIQLSYRHILFFISFPTALLYYHIYIQKSTLKE